MYSNYTDLPNGTLLLDQRDGQVYLFLITRNGNKVHLCLTRSKDTWEQSPTLGGLIETPNAPISDMYTIIKLNEIFERL